MNGTSSSDVSGALLRAYRHWDSRHAAKSSSTEPTTAVTIAISRQTGARGTSVARHLGAQLDWPVYDHELLEQIAQQMKVRVDLVESVDERRVNWLQEQVETFAAAPHVNEFSYFHHLVETVVSLGIHGHSIIVGRGASFLLPPRTTLRVRLVAELRDRINVVAAERGGARYEAERLIREADHERVRFVNDHFHLDIADPLNYDLLLNASRLSIDDCAATVIAALEGMQQRLGDTSQRRAAV